MNPSPIGMTHHRGHGEHKERKAIAKCKLRNANCKLPGISIVHFAIVVLQFAILLQLRALRVLCGEILLISG
jgi:hypothetical protein